jgi:hypothetical protein
VGERETGGAGRRHISRRSCSLTPCSPKLSVDTVRAVTLSTVSWTAVCTPTCVPCVASNGCRPCPSHAATTLPGVAPRTANGHKGAAARPPKRRSEGRPVVGAARRQDRDSSQHTSTSLALQPQRLSSPSRTPQPPEQLRVGHRPGVTTDTPELRSATLLRIRCTRLTRRAPHYRPGVARERVNYCLVPCHRRHRYPCVLKHCYPVGAAWMHLEGSTVGTLRPAGRSALACTSLGHWQTHHVRGAFPFAGGSGLACRSCAPVSFLAAGRRKRTWSLRARAPDRVR